MKRLLVILVLSLITVNMNAQSRGIGGRLNVGLEASYQHFLNDMY